MSKLEVSIVNFEAYKGRSDVKHNSWFRCSNRLLEDPDFFDFSHEEILVWIYILSLGSQKNSHKVTINYHHANSTCRISAEAINSAVRKLKKLKVLEASTLRGRYARDTDACATRQDITDKTRQDITVSADVRERHVPQQLLQSSDFQFFDLIKPITEELAWGWFNTFPQDWLLSELAKARLWCLANERKRPKNSGTFLNSWFTRGWESFRRTIPSKNPNEFDPMTAPLRGT